MLDKATIQLQEGTTQRRATVQITLPNRQWRCSARKLPVAVWDALKASANGKIDAEFGAQLLGVDTLPLTLPVTGAKEGAGASSRKAAEFSIIGVSDDFLWVDYYPQTPKDGQTHANSTSFQVTDKALGLIEGNEFSMPEDGENPGKVIRKFTEDVGKAPGIAGTKPDINRNPYNFVGLAGAKPWIDQPNGFHPGHDRWHPDLLCGTVKVSLEAKTPVFVPAGFPWEKDQTTLRYFCKLHKAGQEHYAIPGSSFKGPLRAMVEAIANDYFGVANKDEYSRKIPYRRRVYRVGQVQTLPEGGWRVQPHSLTPTRTQPGPGKFLLNRRPKAGLHPGTPAREGPPLTLAADVVNEYHRLLEHPHFRRYYDNRVEDAQKRARGEQVDPKLPVYRENLATVEFETIKKDLQLQPGDWIYFTTKTDESIEIDSFGKNVNYLWPSLKSVKDLVKEYFSPDRDLGSPLGLADRMFGFASPHAEGHPFRGKLRFETLWGPKIDDAKPIVLKLAPLTSPVTRAKARPLYLMPKPPHDLSASYSDTDPEPVLRGRKFYWRQNPGGPDQFWPLHKASAAHAEPQRPPPVAALPATVGFEGRLHFRNLSQTELGALLFAIEGAGIPGWEHTLQLGKGKPRGLGTLAVKSVVTLEDREGAWKSLNTPTPVIGDSETTEQIEQCRLAFAKWALDHAGKQGPAAPLAELLKLPHIQDFVALNRWPEEGSVRYYPLHFSEYSWLPTPGKNPDVPAEGHKVKAMRPAGAEYRKWLQERAK